MSQCRKDKAFNTLSRYLLILSAGIFLICISSHIMAQDDPHSPPARQHPQGPPPPPPHPQPPSLKKMFSKINIFKKKDSSPDNANKDPVTTNTTDATASNTSSKKTEQPANAADPQPTGIKPVTTTTTTTTPSAGPLAKSTVVKKKPKKSTKKPAADSKGKVTTPII
ncbi:MAG TPA: hypothetical protein VG367_05510 [Mucilaginibacter sp.]|nr:hypothetical protein [Mucilaginibacter sp.]